MVGYQHRSFIPFLRTSTSSQTINMQKKNSLISTSLDLILDQERMYITIISNYDGEITILNKVREDWANLIRQQTVPITVLEKNQNKPDIQFGSKKRWYFHYDSESQVWLYTFPPNGITQKLKTSQYTIQIIMCATGERIKKSLLRMLLE